MAIKKLGKKGIFLTFISIAIIAAIIIIFTPSDINLQKDLSVIETRVRSINGYVLDLENVYFERTLNAIGRRTFMALIGVVECTAPFPTCHSPEGFFTDSTTFENAFREVLLNGTIGDVPIGDLIDPAYMDPSIMVGNTYTDWFTAIQSTAKNTFNIDTSYWLVVNNISIIQISPWFVDIEANITFSVTSETAAWKKDTLIRTQISVEYFDDPYYLANTDPNYVNKIRKTSTIFNEWTVNKVRDFIRDGNYTHFQNSDAPNFLMRFYDDVSASSCCGLESLVNPNTLAGLGLPRHVEVSYADYQFWSSASVCPDTNPDLYTIAGISGGADEFTNFKIDFNHVNLYQLFPEASQYTCP